MKIYLIVRFWYSERTLMNNLDPDLIKL